MRRRHRSDRLVLIGHGGVYRWMLPVVLTNIDQAFVLAHPFSQSCMVTAEFDRGRLHCVDWSGTTPPQDSDL